ncbi:hypothetical protein D3C85_1202070 [compost metagenome]
MAGSHSVIAITHISVVPAAEITTGRQICLGARDRRQRTTSTQASVTASAMTTALQVNECWKPGISRYTLLAILGGKPVVRAIHMNHRKPQKIVKNSRANQSIALITPRASVGSANAANTAIGGSNRMNCTSPGLRCSTSSRSSAVSIDSGSATWAARRMPRHDSHAQTATGQTGHANRNKFRAMKPAAASDGPP